MDTNLKYKLKVYAISIGIALGVGILSTILTSNNMQIYDEIVTPPLSPPSALFGIVWTILFVLMGISAAIVWINRENNLQKAEEGLVFYGFSLFFNLTWSIIFFNLRWFLFSFIWLLILLYLIIRTVLSYKEVSKTAAYLQIPYILWVTFAGYLNFAIWLLN